MSVVVGVVVGVVVVVVILVVVVVMVVIVVVVVVLVCMRRVPRSCCSGDVVMIIVSCNRNTRDDESTKTIGGMN